MNRFVRRAGFTPPFEPLDKALEKLAMRIAKRIQMGASTPEIKHFFATEVKLLFQQTQQAYHPSYQFQGEHTVENG